MGACLGAKEKTEIQIKLINRKKQKQVQKQYLLYY